ncbi:MAG TPA: hypothetical protein VN937_12760 [Blastocatellia bacterium]|nr:hypothetical protein [Blastocatellia bacterium]
MNMIRNKSCSSCLLLLMLIVAIADSSGSVAWAQSGPSQLEALKEPRITSRKNEKMLVVEAKGDPNIVGAKAFGLLFRLYYSIKETPKGAGQAPPRARWPQSIETPKAEWIGYYGLPVPETVTTLPQYQPQEGLKVSLTIWEYGDVAEILHIGPYDREEPTMERVKSFVKQQGYTTLEAHEEEYVKGPTMSGPGDSEKYLTIIRYRVQKTSRKD